MIFSEILPVQLTIEVLFCVFLSNQLECFLAQRLVELGGEGDVLSGSHSQSAPSSIQVDVAKVTEMLDAVKAITTDLTSVQMHHLMLIRNSPR